MADRDKVINALECCYCNFPKQMDCKNCPYDKICYHDKACSLMLRDALELLKEQPDIVRCKDCVFGKREKNDSTGMTWIYCGHHRENRPEDWFCASGSRI